MVDDFDVDVRNKNLDRMCFVDELSNRQFVLVNEAVNLGIAIYNMRQGEGIRYETLCRDETVGALDAGNGKECCTKQKPAVQAARGVVPISPCPREKGALETECDHESQGREPMREVKNGALRDSEVEDQQMLRSREEICSQ
jgi:hypothetical protein